MSGPGASVFDLADDADALVRSATAWGEVSGELSSAADRLTDGSAAVMTTWEGESATSYDGHRKRLVASLDLAATTADQIATTIARSAGAVRSAQGHLDAQWGTVASVPHVGGGGLLPIPLIFQPEDDAQQQRVTAAITAAQTIRSDLDAALQTDAEQLAAATTTWTSISSEWAGVASGAQAPFDAPTEGDTTGVITTGDQTIINTGSGDDDVRVFVDPLTGDQVVIVNGEVHRFPPGQHLTVRAGGGDDTITISSTTSLDVVVIGGEGDDAIDGGSGSDTVIGLGGDDDVDAGDGGDYVSGGEGRDYVDGQEGDDEIFGGADGDTLYGLDGADDLAGGEGEDYVEGGNDDDRVTGGADDDVVSGGNDDDTIYGGSGDDVTYAGRGDDTTYGGSGTDTSHSESGGESKDVNHDAEQVVRVEIPGDDYFIKIEGSDEFKARVQADLDLLASSPNGRALLDNLQDNHDDSGFLGINKSTLTIREYDDPSDPDNSTASHSGNDYEINLNVRLDELHIGGGGTVEGPPIAVLQHELAHVHDYANDTLAEGDYHGDDPDNQGTPNREREATGLPIDHDDDPDTPEIIDPDHPYELTENGLREEMGVDHRDHY